MTTTFLENEGAPFCWEDEKEAMMRSLLTDDEATIASDHPKVISLVGMGGLGKTTLAKVVFNDEKIQEWFDVKAWVRVWDEFDVYKIIKQILEAISGTNYEHNNSDHQNNPLELKQKLEGKKYLIVLDEVWNDNKSEWDSLLGYLKMAGTSQGCRIVITTRNATVASAAGAVQSFGLRFLNDEECWDLFTYYAFDDDGYHDSIEHHGDLEVVGIEIAKKCHGLPIAARMIGSLLRTNKDVEEWKKISSSLDGNLSHNFDILPAVKLSYDNLPYYLKQCFAYCAKFPKDCEFTKQSLVLSWIQQGLIQSVENKTVEEVASEYFQDLLSRSIFLRSSSNTSRFVMHDLVHDLAMYVSKEFFQQPTVLQTYTEVSFEWGITLVNLVLEILLVTFDQMASPKKPQYALIALVVSSAAMFMCITELLYKGRKQSITWKRQGFFGCSLHCPSSMESPYTCVDAFVLISAIAQLIFSGIAYSFLHRGSESPIKVSFASIIFIICMASSKFFRTPDLPSLPVTRED